MVGCVPPTSSTDMVAWPIQDLIGLACFGVRGILGVLGVVGEALGALSAEGALKGAALWRPPDPSLRSFAMASSTAQSTGSSPCCK